MRFAYCIRSYSQVPARLPCATAARRTERHPKPDVRRHPDNRGGRRFRLPPFASTRCQVTDLQLARQAPRGLGDDLQATRDSIEMELVGVESFERVATCKAF